MAAEAPMRPELAGSGREALNKVRASPRAYDVVILDEALPDHSGGSLARELRALRSNLVLVLTAQENAGRLPEDFSTDGCVAILEAPYTADQLKKTLKALEVDCGD
jgi:DNA-binding response OmpR family regulator